MPQAWPAVRVDEVFTIQQGKQVSKRNRIGNNQRPFLRTKNVLWGHLDLTELDHMHFSPTDEERLALMEGDLLLCEGGDVGRTAMWQNQVSRCYYQNHLHRLRAANGEIDPEFALYWFWHAFDLGNIYFGRKNVTTIPNMSKSRLAELPMPKPALSEQQKIAALLSAVQRAIEQQERLIALTTELKKALMHKLFTEGTRGEPQKQTEIGPVPESWEVVPLGNYADFKNGINFTKDQKGDSGILTVDVLNMYGRGCSISLENLYRVKKKTCHDYLLKNGDLLFVRSSLKQEGVGWTSMYSGGSEAITFCGFIIRARLRQQRMFDPGFLTYYFRTEEARGLLRAGGARVAITNINQGMLKQTLVPKPSLAEQEEIKRAIDLADQKIATHEQQRASLHGLFRTLLHQLMTAQVRVSDLDLGEFAIIKEEELSP